VTANPHPPCSTMQCTVTARVIMEGHRSAFTSPREHQLTRSYVLLFGSSTSLLSPPSFSFQLLLTFVFGTENLILSYLFYPFLKYLVVIMRFDRRQRSTILTSIGNMKYSTPTVCSTCLLDVSKLKPGIFSAPSLYH
jgi:hypothetical protein